MLTIQTFVSFVIHVIEFFYSKKGHWNLIKLGSFSSIFLLKWIYIFEKRKKLCAWLKNINNEISIF
jgi:hypothetical protein